MASGFTLDGRPLPVENGKQEVDEQNQQEIRLEVQRLYAMATDAMATELKAEVDRTNANAVLESIGSEARARY